MKADPAAAPVSGQNGLTTRHLSAVPGGLRQFGLYLDTLDPGGWSSYRHWHAAEDEFLYVLEGTATLRDGFGTVDLGPGDAVAWPFGDPNAHHLTNRGAAPCRWLIAGMRVAGDICTYPDDGRRLVNGATGWQMLATDGSLLREGELPAELRDLPPRWGVPVAGSARRVLRAADRAWVAETGYVHPVLGGGLGDYDHAVLGDAGGLSQFGVHLERLPPGGRSSFRHWHMAEDEAVYVLSGRPVLVEDGETPLAPGDLALWPAGRAVGHCLTNPGLTNPGLTNPAAEPAVYLTFGTRLPQDTIHYPDHDLITYKDGPARRYAHADGRPRMKGART